MRRSDRRTWLIVAAGIAAVGVLLLVVAWRHQQSAPAAQPAGEVTAPPSRSPSPQGGPTGSAKPTKEPPLGPSRPVRLRIPSIDVDTTVNQLGLAPDGTLQVPQPGPQLDEAAWFEGSPTPGQPGPSIIEGHVDTEEGPSVFFRLGDIRVGDKVRVRRADGSRLVFEVNAIRDFPKSEFPTELVYGSDLSKPTLRLITCSDFNTTTRHHEGNQVVFAHLTHVSGAHHS